MFIFKLVIFIFVFLVALNKGNSYQITVNGKPYSVNIVSQSGESINDVDGYLTNDYGEELPIQKNAVLAVENKEIWRFLFD